MAASGRKTAYRTRLIGRLRHLLPHCPRGLPGGGPVPARLPLSLPQAAALPLPCRAPAAR